MESTRAKRGATNGEREGPAPRPELHRSTIYRQPRSRSLALTLLVALTAGCEPETPPVGCGFGPIHLHAHAEGGELDDVALTSTSSGAALVYSDRSGTHVRHLDRDGAGRGAPVRLGPSCPGGLATVAQGERLLVTCARPADPDRGRVGEVLLMELDGARVRELGRVPGLRARSRGVDLTAEGRRVVVGWLDADELSARAWVAEHRDGSFREPRALSSEPMLASPPSLLLRDGALHAAWTESWLEAGGAAAGHLFVQREGEPPVPSLDLNGLRVPVRLGWIDGPVVALRDRRPRGADHDRALIGRLDERLRLVPSALRSPARADDPEAIARLVQCGEHVLSVTTRRSRRQVTMVSLRRLGADLRPVEAEHQIYEYHARFPQAVAACIDDQLVVAVGEQRTRVSPVPRLRTYVLRCGPGIAHERTPGTEGQVLRKRGAEPR